VNGEPPAAVPATALPGPRPPRPAAPPQRVLRRLFLTLFLRGRTSRGLKKERAPKSLPAKLALTLLFYALFGCLPIGLARHSAFTLAVYLHAMTFVFLGLFVAGSSGEMLFNKEEADILLHRPVAPRDLLWAKVRVLVEVSLWIGGAFNLAGTVAGIFAPGGGVAFPLAHALSTTLEALLCAGFVVVVYQLCLRWCGRERLEALMTTAQVAIATSAVLAGQIVPRLLQGLGERGELDLGRWWLALLPPVWFASLDDLLTGHVAGAQLLLAAIGVAATALVLGLAVTRLAHDYEVGLQSLHDTRAELSRGRGDRRRLLDRLVAAPPLSWWLRDPVERASFLLCAAYLARDRDVKLRVYPALAPIAIMPIFMIVEDRGARGASLGGFSIAFVGFMAAIVPLFAINLLQYSQQWQAADLFRIAPIRGPGPLSNGGRRAVVLLLALPILLLCALLVVALHGASSALLLLLPGAIAMPAYSMLTPGGADAVPLSQPSEEAKSTARGLVMMVAMLVSVALAGAAAVTWSTGWFLPYLGVEAALSAGLCLWARESLKQARWSKWE
jgi:ABC-2 type transport system permease protein